MNYFIFLQKIYIELYIYDLKNQTDLQCYNSFLVC